MDKGVVKVLGYKEDVCMHAGPGDLLKGVVLLGSCQLVGGSIGVCSEGLTAEISLSRFFNLHYRLFQLDSPALSGRLFSM